MSRVERVDGREKEWERFKGAGFTVRQSDSTEFGMFGVLAYGLLCQATGAKTDSGVGRGGVRPQAGRQMPSETEDGG